MVYRGVYFTRNKKSLGESMSSRNTQTFGSDKNNNRNRKQKSRQLRNRSSNQQNMLDMFNSRPQFKRIQWPMPNMFRTTLKYYQQIPYSAISTPQVYYFRGNSIYDPDYTGTGAQPVGFDQLSVFYSRYNVVGSRIEIKIINESTPALQVITTPYPSVDVTTYDQAYLLPYTRRAIADGITRGGRSIATLAHQAQSTIVRQQPWNINYTSATSTNPSLQWFWLIAMQTADQATSITCELQITILYDVIFNSPLYVPLS